MAFTSHQMALCSIKYIQMKSWTFQKHVVKKNPKPLNETFISTYLLQ